MVPNGKLEPLTVRTNPCGCSADGCNFTPQPLSLNKMEPGGSIFIVPQDGQPLPATLHALGVQMLGEVQRQQRQDHGLPIELNIWLQTSSLGCQETKKVGHVFSLQSRWGPILLLGYAAMPIWGQLERTLFGHNKRQGANIFHTFECCRYVAFQFHTHPP